MAKKKAKRKTIEEKIVLGIIAAIFLKYVKQKTDHHFELRTTIVKASPKKSVISRVGSAGYIWRSV